MYASREYRRLRVLIEQIDSSSFRNIPVNKFIGGGGAEL